jgi:4-amino-4-deoxy-L-arabinose transferase-like glycosyltransferase
MVLAQVARGDRQGTRWWLWLFLGAVIGVASLVRQDGLFLVPFLVVPAAILSSRHTPRRCLAQIAVSVVAVAVVLAPWVIRNVAEFGEPTLSTLSSSTSLAGANCDQTYYGADLGSWNFACIHEEETTRLDEEAYSRSIRSQAIDYVESHLDRVPIVAAARALRVWGLWDPTDLTQREAVETRNRGWQYVAYGCAFVTLVTGLIGIGILARKKRPVVLLISMLAMVTTLAMLTNGNTRFRSIAEPALLVGVGTLAVVLWDRWRGGRGGLPETAQPEHQARGQTTTV